MELLKRLSVVGGKFFKKANDVSRLNEVKLEQQGWRKHPKSKHPKVYILFLCYLKRNKQNCGTTVRTKLVKKQYLVIDVLMLTK